MKGKFFYLTAFATLVMACGGNKNQQSAMIKGVDVADMDTTSVPGDDFYRFACGGWMDSHPLKPEYARFGTFDALRETSQEQVRNLIEELAAKENEKGSVPQKIGDLYKMATDSSRLNAEGANPLKKYIDEVNAIQNKSELSAFLAKMFRNGMSPFFSNYVYADDMNSSINIFHINQGGYKMGDRDYYFEKDPRSEELRTKYAVLINQLFTLSGFDQAQTKAAGEAVMKMETQLAGVAYPRVKLRIPTENYHKITIEELQKNSPAIDWKVFFKTLGLSGIKDLNLSQPEPLAEVSKVIQQYSLDEIKYYLNWSVITSSASFMSDAFGDASFEYYGKALSGRQEQKARWKRAVDVVNGTLGEAVGQMYVNKYFPPAHKTRMTELVKNLQIALGERIDGLAWMGDSTKIKAHEKLNAFHVKIGYPDKWRDYSGLNVNSSDSYLDNIIRSNNFDYDYMLSKFDQPVDKDEWLMTPQTVNAYYNPATNEICFPAAILQPPFFNMEADDAVNYGAIGVVIGHEMTHGFDDQGRQYDKDGNLVNWWTEEDAKRFDERADVLVKFFDNIVVLDTVHANGRYTLGENIADQGGLQVSWQAYQNSLKGKETPVPVAGFTNSQRFFIGYATVWAGNIRDAEILNLTKMDSHSLGRWRVNGALPHIDAWYNAFGVTESNKLYVPKEKRVAIW